MIATVRDVTEQVRLREQLTSERDLSAAILDTMQDGFGVTRDREIQEVNPALCRVTGFTREQLIGAKQPFPFWPPELHEDIGELRDRSRREQRQLRGDVPARRRVTLHRGGDHGRAAGPPAARAASSTPCATSPSASGTTAMQERGHQLAALAGMTRALAHAAPAEARRTVAETALRIADADTASIWEADPEGVLHCTISVGAPSGRVLARAGGRRRPRPAGVRHRPGHVRRRRRGGPRHCTRRASRRPAARRRTSSRSSPRDGSRACSR